jgi:hypothetical protein
MFYKIRKFKLPFYKCYDIKKSTFKALPEPSAKYT